MSENFVKEWVINKDFEGLRIDYWLKKKFFSQFKKTQEV